MLALQLVKSNRKSVLFFVLIAHLGLSLSGCAYQWGYKQKSLPGGYTEIAVPMFKNSTDLVGIEAKFTNFLIHEFSRSKVARIVDKNSSPVYIEGEIVSLKFEQGGQLDANQSNENPGGTQPRNTVMTSDYRALADVQVRLIRSSDQKILWTGAFKNERVYIAPQVKLAGANTVNPLYNHSARIEVAELLAEDMMIEAHDRMIENF